MAKIKIKNSVTTGSVPAGLSFGEVAINIPDKKIFVGNAVESTVTLYDPNNHVLSFNGQTGAVSFVNYVSSVNGATGAVTISPAGSTGYIQYHTGAGFSADDGLQYDASTETFRIGSGSTHTKQYSTLYDNFLEGYGSNLRIRHATGKYISIGDNSAYGSIGNGTYILVSDNDASISLYAQLVWTRSPSLFEQYATFDQYVNLKGGLKILGSSGTTGQVLTSTGTGITWSTVEANIGCNNIMITDNATTPDVVLNPVGTVSTSITNTANFGPTGSYMLLLLPFMFDKGVTLSRIATLQGGSPSGHTGSLMFAVYDTNPSTGLPYTLKYASAETNLTTSAFQRYAATPSLQLNRGAYWIGFLLNHPSGKASESWSWAAHSTAYAFWDAYSNGSRWFNNGAMTHLRYRFSGMTLGAVGSTLTHGFTSALTNNTHPAIGWGTSEMSASARQPNVVVSVIQ